MEKRLKENKTKRPVPIGGWWWAKKSGDYEVSMWTSEWVTRKRNKIATGEIKDQDGVWKWKGQWVPRKKNDYKGQRRATEERKMGGIIVSEQVTLFYCLFEFFFLLQSLLIFLSSERFYNRHVCVIFCLLQYSASITLFYLLVLRTNTPALSAIRCVCV